MAQLNTFLTLTTSHTDSLPTIAITAGEPAGIGPDLCVRIAQLALPANIVVIANRKMLEARAVMCNLPFHVNDFDGTNDQRHHGDGTLTVLNVPLQSNVTAGQLNPANSTYVLETLRIATAQCLAHSPNLPNFDALVTAPVHKGVINDAGIIFSGHTEYLADLTHTPHVVMMLVGGNLRVALASTHLALKDVPAAITQQSLEKTIRVLHQDLIEKFGIENPRILVAGLNPHAGEDGYLGREEIEIINPILQTLRNEGMQLIGALPADTLFAKHHLAHADAVLAMYHDQGLPVLKHASFGEGVNITLGLPLIRTSVDHGTALDLAGCAEVNIGSMVAAITLAIDLANRKRQQAFNSQSI